MMQIKKFEFNPFPVNTYLLWDETGEAALIDAGMYHTAEEEELTTFIESNNLKLTLLLNTHLHFDHCFGNAFVNEKWGLLTHAGEADAFLLEAMPQQAGRFGIRLKRETPPIGELLKGGEVVQFGNTELKTLHVPGHSPGSIVFYNEQDSVIFAGDVLFNGSIGRTDLPGGDYDTLISNIKSKLMTLPEEVLVCSGHGPTTTIEKEKRTNMFLK